MLLNPCAFTRRVTLELDGQPGPVAVEGPVKASQFDAGKSRLVVELPPLGYAWVPRGSPSTPVPKQRIKMAEPLIVRNEFFEAEIDPATGGLRSFRDLRTRTNHLAAQVVFNPGSRMEARDIRMTVNGSALGELVAESVLLDTANEELATVRQRFARGSVGRCLIFGWRSSRKSRLRVIRGIPIMPSAWPGGTNDPPWREEYVGQRTQRITLGRRPRISWKFGWGSRIPSFTPAGCRSINGMEPGCWISF